MFQWSYNTYCHLKTQPRSLFCTLEGNLTNHEKYPLGYVPGIPNSVSSKQNSLPFPNISLIFLKSGKNNIICPFVLDRNLGIIFVPLPPYLPLSTGEAWNRANMVRGPFSPGFVCLGSFCFSMGSGILSSSVALASWFHQLNFCIFFLLHMSRLSDMILCTGFSLHMHSHV